MTRHELKTILNKHGIRLFWRQTETLLRSGSRWYQSTNIIKRGTEAEYEFEGGSSTVGPLTRPGPNCETGIDADMIQVVLRGEKNDPFFEYVGPGCARELAVVGRRDRYEDALDAGYSPRDARVESRLGDVSE